MMDRVLARLAGSALLPALTIVLALTHGALAILHAIGLAAPVRRPDTAPESILVAVTFVDSTWWGAVHALVAALLLAGVIARLRTPVVAIIGCGASMAASLVWGVPLVAWSLSVVPPISLTAPVLLLTLAVPTAALCMGAWADRDD